MTVQCQQFLIEPHFPFNSLSTVLSLMDTDREKAGKMLTDLTRLLRISLSKARAETTTMDHEMEMAGAYLNIYRIRMGDRLRYLVDVEEDLKKKSIPPMLVQPLVENAIRHGLGLTNIRERLHSLYGQSGKLTVVENRTGGVTATIEIPHG